VEERDSREWEYNGVQQSRIELSVGDGYGKLVVEEELEVGL
jgi:hypothetical protein